MYDFMKAYYKVCMIPFKMSAIILNTIMYPSRETSVVLTCAKCGGVNDEPYVSWIFMQDGSLCSRCFDKEREE